MDSDEIALVSTVLDYLLAAWVRYGRPAPPTALRAQGMLRRALAKAVVATAAPDFGGLPNLSQDDMIGTGEVAELLGCDRKTVQRRAEELGGQRIAGRFLFDRTELGA